LPHFFDNISDWRTHHFCAASLPWSTAGEHFSISSPMFVYRIPGEAVHNALPGILNAFHCGGFPVRPALFNDARIFL